MREYAYDVFISFTGADREIKNAVCSALEERGLTVYDSDKYCKGGFREDYTKALDQSRVYLMLLSDSLRKMPDGDNGWITEVRLESRLACDLDAKGQLNIVLLNTSEFFKYGDGFHDYNDILGWHFYCLTRGLSRIDARFDESGALLPEILEKIVRQCGEFVSLRNEGKPAPSQKKSMEITSQRLIAPEVFKGREDERKKIRDAFSSGKQIVVLSGIGGMGKTTLASSVAIEFEQSASLRCPQIVRIQEMAGSGGGLNTLVSSVSYEKSVYESLTTLNEREKYERKLKALSELPENVLLIVDNYNTLSSHALKEVIKNLKCRLLITTRARIEDMEQVEIVPIRSLAFPEAKEMFEETYGGEVSEGEFKPLYDKVGGHTITLCIMAKMIKKHNLSVSSLIEKMNELDMEERVDFEHNEIENTDTVLGHLTSLFGISNFSQKSKDILRSMSLLSDGVIAERDLTSVMGLNNRNEILELLQSGWLESEGENLVLHPILGQLMAKILAPSQESDGAMIDYILAKTEEEQASLTYSGAGLLEDKLYYACFVLASSCGKLPKALWDKFVEVNYLVCDIDDTTHKAQELSKKLVDKGEKDIVTSYSDMVTIEQRPTALDIIEKYLDALNENYANYKWVLRGLSITAKHLSANANHKKRVQSAVLKALEVAMNSNDDFAVADLIPYVLVTDGECDIKKVQRYIKRRRKESGNNGELMLLELLVNSFIMYGGSAEEYIENVESTFDEVSEERYGKILGLLLRHPIISIKSALMGKNAEKLPDSDRLKQYLLNISSMSEYMAYEGKMDARTLIENTIILHNYQLEAGQTLASAEEKIMNTVALFGRFTAQEMGMLTDEIVEGIDMVNLTPVALSSLQVSAVVSLVFRDKRAIEQRKMALDAVRRLRPSEHVDVIDSLIYYGDTLSAFGQDGEAFNAYEEARQILQKNASDSSKLCAVAIKIMGIYSVRRKDLEYLEEVYIQSIEGMSEDDEGFYYRNKDYATVLCGAYGDAVYKERNALRSEQSYRAINRPIPLSVISDKMDASQKKQTVIEKLKQLVSKFDDCSKTITKKSVKVQNAFTNCVLPFAKALMNNKLFDEAEKLGATLACLKKSKKVRVRNSADIESLFLKAYGACHRGEKNSVDLLRETLKKCVKNRSGFATAMSSVYLEIYDRKRYADDKDIGRFVAQFVKNKKKLQKIYETMGYLMDNYIEDDDGCIVSDDDLEKVVWELFGRIEIGYRKNFGFTARDFYKIKKIEDVYYAVFINFFEEVMQRCCDAQRCITISESGINFF